MLIGSKPLLSLTLILSAIMLGGCSANLPEAAVSASPQWAMSGDPEIASAIGAIERDPNSPAAHSNLAILYIKKARETGDFSLNEYASRSLENALRLAPGDLTARKLRASLHLTFHEFAEGLSLGNELLKELPDDAFVWGVLTDANAELGNYSEAVKAGQRMLDIRPNAASYARAAHLRSIHGDHAGAVEMYILTAKTTDPVDKEAQSWCLVQLGNEYRRNGKYSDAQKAYDEALGNLPDYHLALAGKGRVMAAQNDLAAASHFLQMARDRTPSTENIILLGDVYTQLGDTEKARRQYDMAEAGGEKLGNLHDGHRLALFWADNNTNLDEALRIAREDYAAQKDIYAADTLAWCLYRKGMYQEAKTAAREAMRLETNDAGIWFHAGMIEKALGNRREARRLLNAALKLDPAFDAVRAAEARKAVSEL